MDEQRRSAIDSALNNPSGGPSGTVAYDPGESLLHRLHPLTKIAFSAGIVAIVFMFSDFRGPFGVLLLLLGILVLFGFAVELLRVGFLISLPIGFSLLAVHGLFNPENETPLFVLEPVPVLDTLIVWQEGIQFGLLFYFRILTVIVALLTLIKTTHPRKLSIGLTEKGVPSNFTYVFMAALQLAPQMKEQARSIADAQQARGLDTRANIVQRFKSLIAMLTPLLVGMLITTQTRALALESRGFSRRGPRTYLLEVTDTALDRALRWGTAMTAVGVFVWQVVL